MQQQNYSYLPNPHPSYVYQVVPGISMAASDTSKASDDLGKLAEGKTTGNTSAISKELKDFVQIMEIKGSDSTYITAKQMKKAKSGSIFKGNDAQEIANKFGYITQNSIFQQNIAHDGGLRYANQGANIKESAIDFSTSVINAIESAFQLLQKTEDDNGIHPEWRQDKGKIDGKLTVGELRSQDHGINDEAYRERIQNTDCDGDRTSTSVYELASMVIAPDVIFYNEDTQKYDYDFSIADGLITEEEVAVVKKMDDNTLHKIIKEIYNEYITNKKAGKKDTAK